MKIWIVRHGQTIPNQKEIIQGQIEGELSDLGKIQAQNLADRLKNEDFDMVFVSDAYRALDTSKIILQYHPNLEAKVDILLRERNYGEFLGKPHQQRDEMFPGLNKEEIYSKFQSVETLKQIYDRANKFYERNILQYLDTDKNILVVAHKHINAELCRVIERKPYLDFVDETYHNASVTLYSLKSDLVDMVLFNDISHL